MRRVEVVHGTETSLFLQLVMAYLAKKNMIAGRSVTKKHYSNHAQVPLICPNIQVFRPISNYILFVIIFMTFENHISDKGSSSYTVTTNGSCSANCGNGSRIVITLSCHIQASSLFKCDKNITYEPCNLRECPSKLLWCLLNPISMILI